MYLGYYRGRQSMDPSCPCNLLELQQGGIRTQVCAIFTAPEPHATRFAHRQLTQLAGAQRQATDLGIRLLWALEHAGGLFDSVGPDQWKQLDHWAARLGPCLYIGPTWNGPSLFGGGAGTQEGLSAAGRELLVGMKERRIALDFSHMSDAMARDCLNWLDQNAPDLPVLASHSNCRDIMAVERNLPRWLMQALVDRRGVIGLCWYPRFVGKEPTALLRHVELLLEMSPDAVASGADLFAVDDPYPASQASTRVSFFPELSRARHMHAWSNHLESAFGAGVRDQILRENAARWARQITALAGHSDA
jgi:membrane dipeptidase